MVHSTVTQLCFLITHVIFLKPHISAKVVEPSQKSFAWGPGLRPSSLVLPVRYFFIQAVDSAGQNLTGQSIPPPFQLTVQPRSGHCGIFSELLDRKDGTYIARFRVYESCRGLRLEVRLHNGQHIQGSPWLIEETVLHSNCDCPLTLDEWKEAASCPAAIPQIDRDVNQFSHEIPIDVTAHFHKLSATYHPQSASFCHYVMKSGQLYRKCFGEHVGFAIFMDTILLFLMRRAKLSDVNFISNLGDYPLSSRAARGGSIKAPVFSWCGSMDSFDIVMPTYDITESSLTGMDRVTLDMLSVQATQTPIWPEKIPKAFWRGRDARQERLYLVEIARNHSDIMDAALTNFFFFRDQEEQFGPKAPHVDFFQFFQYKYQINLDGTVAAYRFPYLLAGDGLIFKQESPYYEHFYPDLAPWQHYIPVRRDLSDLVERINWAREHDAEAWNISRSGAEFARTNLLPHNVFCYYTLLLEKWTKFALPIREVPRGYEVVQQTEGPAVSCDCAAEMKDFVRPFGSSKNEL
ncbi:KDEL motif-containing protein 1 [Hypsibius exemplaris]|uniref:KDEL motif-containing protein 1 n=1 Tax=Hypsibius exemplaris TaxID=2072580 RepID=A0A1W0WLP9_HYPEX|nr:KDEL motif-containing protein 1 [Hypsibius exemplaris]